jgi:hypothetical protein
MPPQAPASRSTRASLHDSLYRQAGANCPACGSAFRCSGDTKRGCKKRSWLVSFEQRRLLDREDLERQLREWLTEANTVRPSRATGVPPATRIVEERARLRPLKVARPIWRCGFR